MLGLVDVFGAVVVVDDDDDDDGVVVESESQWICVAQTEVRIISASDALSNPPRDNSLLDLMMTQVWECLIATLQTE